MTWAWCSAWQTRSRCWSTARSSPSTRPTPCGPMPGCRRPTWAPCWPSSRRWHERRPHPQAGERPRLLWQEPCAAWREPGGQAGRDRQPARPQRRRPLDHGQDHHGPGRRQGFGPVRRCRAGRPQGLRHRAAGPGLCAGEPRCLPQADRPPEPDAGPEAAWRPAAALELRRHVPDVPAPEGAPAHRGRRALGWRAADADAVPHADGRPRPDHDRRAHRGPGAQDRRAGGRIPEGIASAGAGRAAGRAKARHRARDLRALLCDGPWPHRLRGHARRAARQRLHPQGVAGGLASAPPFRPASRCAGRGRR
mmetsp:Transcript_57648/g.135657  ORF Transcript_57648/g.135657 Transcript_57648/m.135657 type:complete len:308 (-) Transcript_57648:143-1066(-)